MSANCAGRLLRGFFEKEVQTVGATEMLEIVAQEPVIVQVDTLHGVSQSLRFIAHPRC